MSKKTRGNAGVIITKPERDGIWISKRADNLPGGNKWFAGYHQVPGGKIDPGETPRQAAVRELAEETGLVATNPDEPGRSAAGAVPLLPMHCGTFKLPDGRPFDSEHFLMITEQEPQHLEQDSSDAWRYVPIEKLHMLQFMPSTLAAISFALRYGFLKSPDFTHVSPASKKPKLDLTQIVKPLKWTKVTSKDLDSTNTVGPTYNIIRRGIGHWQLVLSNRRAGDRGDVYPRRRDATDAANVHFRAVLSKYLKL